MPIILCNICHNGRLYGEQETCDQCKEIESLKACVRDLSEVVEKFGNCMAVNYLDKHSALIEKCKER